MHSEFAFKARKLSKICTAPRVADVLARHITAAAPLEGLTRQCTALHCCEEND